MILQEFSTEFDILYNNIASGAAPGINAYEKSLLLTDAQEAIVKAYYTGDIQKLIPGFEDTERRRRELEELVRTYSVSYDPVLNEDLISRKIHSDSIFFTIPDDTWYILHEQGQTDDDPCTDEGRGIKIYPMKLDYFNKQISNPFRKPNKKECWRMDLESFNDERIIEIVNLSLPIKNYYMRYIHAPVPIVLVDFESDPDISGMNLTVRGINTQSNCEINSVDKEIVKLAVTNAIIRYRENTINNIK